MIQATLQCIIKAELSRHRSLSLLQIQAHKDDFNDTQQHMCVEPCSFLTVA